MTGYVLKISGGSVTWNSQRQSTVSLSTTEAEYVAASSVAKEAMWIRGLLRDMQEPIEKTTPIFMDNQSAIKLVHNAEFNKKTKHAEVRYHYIREKYASDEIDVSYVTNKKQIADILTKPIPRDRFEILRNMLSVKKM